MTRQRLACDSSTQEWNGNMTNALPGIADLFPSRVSYIWLKWEEATNREFRYSISLWENFLRGICFCLSRWYLIFFSFFCCVLMWRSTGKTYGKKWAQERGTGTQWGRRAEGQANKELVEEFDSFVVSVFSEDEWERKELKPIKKKTTVWCMGKYFLAVRKTFQKLN